jgi:hypothetical protein
MALEETNIADMTEHFIGTPSDLWWNPAAGAWTRSASRT